MIGGDLLWLPLDKPAASAFAVYNRLIKELRKVFFTLVLK